MYTQQDMNEITRRLKKYWLITGVLEAIVIAVFVLGLVKRWEALVMVFGGLFFCVACYMFIMYLLPCIRYRGFLRDMNTGLGREIEGTVVEVSGNEDLQDGVRVLPVRILLKEEEDERIVYLNASKAELFPKEGAAVRLNCYGRHIKEVLV